MEGRMEFRRPGGSGLQVPVSSLGTGRSTAAATTSSRGWGGTQHDAARRFVDRALDAGVTMFDGADVYSAGLAGKIQRGTMGSRNATVV